jgi:hypothetical protein
MPTVVPPTMTMPPIAPGDRIRVTQRIIGRNGTWISRVEGTVASRKAEPTGSWYAHGKGDKLWLVRVRLQKDDGEITALVIDHNSTIELLAPAVSAGTPSAIGAAG